MATRTVKKTQRRSTNASQMGVFSAAVSPSAAAGSAISKVGGGKRSREVKVNEGTSANDGRTTYGEVNYLNNLVDQEVTDLKEELEEDIEGLKKEVDQQFADHQNTYHKPWPGWVKWLIGGGLVSLILGVIAFFNLDTYDGILSSFSRWQEDRIRQIIEEGNITVIKTASGSATIEMYKFEMKKEN